MTQEDLKEYFNYDSNTGIFIRIKKTGRSAKINVRSGSLDNEGYRQMRFKGGVYREHRLAWLYHYGKMPDGQIDHINRIKDDNRICNLRDVTNSENQRNSPMNKANTTGHLGVYPRANGRWCAQISGKHIGTFGSKEEAITARKLAEKSNNYHENHGKGK